MKWVRQQCYSLILQTEDGGFKWGGVSPKFTWPEVESELEPQSFYPLSSSFFTTKLVLLKAEARLVVWVYILFLGRDGRGYF